MGVIRGMVYAQHVSDKSFSGQLGEDPRVTACCCRVYQMKKLTKTFLATVVISVLSFGSAGEEVSSGHTSE